MCLKTQRSTWWSSYDYSISSSNKLKNHIHNYYQTLQMVKQFHYASQQQSTTWHNNLFSNNRFTFMKKQLQSNFYPKQLIFHRQSLRERFELRSLRQVLFHDLLINILIVIYIKIHHIKTLCFQNKMRHQQNQFSILTNNVLVRKTKQKSYYFDFTNSNCARERRAVTLPR
jgi:hypothetical protein